MPTWGISALAHDAAIAVIDDRGEVLFASHSERYSRLKNDPHLNDEIVEQASQFGRPDNLVWYEKPFKKRLRQLYAGQYAEALSLGHSPRTYLNQWGLLADVPLQFVGHHASHAGAGFYTSTFTEATVVVVDAIGEWDTVTIWSGSNGQLKCLQRWTYPNSLGLLYSAFTQRVGLKPNEDEYILMGMASYGQPIHCKEIRDHFLSPKYLLSFKQNPHVGADDFLPNARNEDLAASVQRVLEEELQKIFELAKKICPSENIVYMGGVALNCVANAKLASHSLFKNIWIMPNPGDAGSSLGAAATFLQKPIHWRGPYLGHEIKGSYPVDDLLQELLSTGIVGVAHGRCEFGPRALGARSLLADPRKPSMKDRVNSIKQRQSFRPFAPVIMLEHARQWFDMVSEKDPYMQYVAQCKHPQKVPAVCHFDNSSRVQTLQKHEHPGLYELLEKWHAATGCPMLLNTSLNIKGEPIVNTKQQAQDFAARYGVKVY